LSGVDLGETIDLLIGGLWFNDEYDLAAAIVNRLRPVEYPYGLDAR
jgi:hypothetical protein